MSKKSPSAKSSSGRSVDSEAKIQRILAHLESELRKKLVSGPQTLEEIEQQSEDIGEDLKRVMEQEILREKPKDEDGAQASCSCGQLARYVGMRKRQVITRHGIQVFCRAYYYCSACRSGWCPFDRTLRLEKGQCSRVVVSLIARFCSYLPYRTAAQELEALCGLRLSVRTLERHAQLVGERIAADWDRKHALLEQRKSPLSEVRPSCLHATMDGVMIFRDGEWHEVKLGCVYERKGKEIVARYYATTECSTVFGKKLWTLAATSGADRCAKLVLVADGSAWIWQEAGKYFPQSVQILDFYHATQHLWTAAHAWFGVGTDAANAWMKQQKERLMQDQVQQVITDLKTWSPNKVGHRDIRRQVLAYLTTHQPRMMYQTFEKQGFHIGSGVIEAGCKNVVQSRLKGVGMRWKKPGAEAMLQLCAHAKTTGYQGFLQYSGTIN